MSSQSASTMSATTSPSAASSSAAAGTIKVSGNLKIVGIVLAITSGVLIGSSFVFKKKGLLRSQRGAVAGEGVAYLKSPLWWTGMSMMIAGELCNFAAYAFVEAIVVTPMGALSVVICAILSSFFLNEKLTLFGWLGCSLCIIGSIVIALNGPSEPSVGEIVAFQHLFLSAGFLVYGSLLIAASLTIIFWFAPRYGKQNMLWYIFVCSMIGGISVSVTTGLGSAIVTSAMGDNQFKHWFIYFLLVFIIVTLVTEVYYLNVALALFNTAMVTPTYYVIFTFFSILTTIVLFKGLSAPASQIITLVMGFLVICVGITVLQLSKIDPTTLQNSKLPGLDRRSTMLLQAARSNTIGVDEKDVAAIEDPGIDTLRGSFGAMGSIIRARSARRMSMSVSSAGRAGVGTGTKLRSRHGNGSESGGYDPYAETQPHYNAMGGHTAGGQEDQFAGMKRHQLYDPPMRTPPAGGDAASFTSSQHQLVQSPTQMGSPRKLPAIKFRDEEIVHSYPVTGKQGDVIHEYRSAFEGRHTHGDGSYIPLANQTASASHLGLTLDQSGLRSAPPALYDDPYRSHPIPAAEDPFANSPSTTTLSNFPPQSYPFYQQTTGSSSTTGATVGFGTRESKILYDEDGSIKPSPVSPPLAISTPPLPQRPNLDRLFGRSRSSSPGHSGRHQYPKGDMRDDREESVSLVHPDPTYDGDREPNSADSDSDLFMELPPQGSIRLVPPQPPASVSSMASLTSSSGTTLSTGTGSGAGRGTGFRS